MEMADEIVVALDDIGVEPEILKGGDNFNVSFSTDDETYYIRPNDKGDDLLYMTAKDDERHTMKLKDIDALVAHIKSDILDK